MASVQKAKTQPAKWRRGLRLQHLTRRSPIKVLQVLEAGVATAMCGVLGRVSRCSLLSGVRNQGGKRTKTTELKAGKGNGGLG